MKDADVARALALVAEECGQYLLSVHRGSMVVATKSHRSDLVTQFDLEAEKLIRARLAELLPGCRVVGEELPASGDGELTCYVDPIDGTSNFVAGLPFYCVSIGAERDGRLIAGAIHDPERAETFWGTRAAAYLGDQRLDPPSGPSTDETGTCLISWPHEGQDLGLGEQGWEAAVRERFKTVRRLGSAALGLAYVAAGRADATSELIASPWDVAAGFLLVTAAGGQVRTVARPISGPPWYSPQYVAHAAGFVFDSSAMAAVVE